MEMFLQWLMKKMVAVSYGGGGVGHRFTMLGIIIGM